MKQLTTGMNTTMSSNIKETKKTKSANPKPGRLGTMLATPLTESEKARLRKKHQETLETPTEYRKANPIKPI